MSNWFNEIKNLELHFTYKTFGYSSRRHISKLRFKPENAIELLNLHKSVWKLLPHGVLPNLSEMKGFSIFILLDISHLVPVELIKSKLIFFTHFLQSKK